MKQINQVFGFMACRRAGGLGILSLHSKQASLDNWGIHRQWNTWGSGWRCRNPPERSNRKDVDILFAGDAATCTHMVGDTGCLDAAQAKGKKYLGPANTVQGSMATRNQGWMWVGRNRMDNNCLLPVSLLLPCSWSPGTHTQVPTATSSQSLCAGPRWNRILQCMLLVLELSGCKKTAASQRELLSFWHQKPYYARGEPT